VGAICRLVREDPVDASTALFDDIRDVGIGGHYLGAKSTRRLYRAGELWQPQTYRRAPFETYAGSTLVKEAQAKAEEIIAADLKTPVADDVSAAADKVIAGYRATKA
jgi:trimethylamine:corrinoid methyltransferase-like protein